MKPRRVFLDWNKACLPAAAAYIVEKYRSQKVLDLQQLTVVTSGSRASRRLLEILLDLCEIQQLAFTPPRAITVGTLPELLVRQSLPRAPLTISRFCWSQALAALPVSTLHEIIPHPPKAGEFLQWLGIAEQIEQLYAEVAAGGLLFSEVAGKLQAMPDWNGDERWNALAQAEVQYFKILGSHGYVDRHHARIVGARSKQAQAPGPLLLIAATDLNSITKQLLELVAGEVTVLVHAPETEAAGFDDFGAVVAESWAQRLIPLRDDQFSYFDSFADQGQAIVDQLRISGQSLRAEQISLGIGDGRVLPFVVDRVEQEGIVTRVASGKALAETAPLTFISHAASFLSLRTFQNLSSLVRHPDVLAWLGSELSKAGELRLNNSETLALLDRYQYKHLQAEIGRLEKDGELPGQDEDSLRANLILSLIDKLLAAFDRQIRPLAAWVEPCAKTLQLLFADRECSRHDPIERELIDACDQIRDTLITLAETPAGIGQACDAGQALSILAHFLKSEVIGPQRKESAIEVLGWLELPLDDAELLLVAGFNEGSVVESVTSDAFLPDSTRTHLGLLDNARRYARDAYALTTILQSRPRVHLIGGRFDSQGERLEPSRLVYACDQQLAAKRVLKLTTHQNIPRLKIRKTSSGFALPVPAVAPVVPIEQMSVTSFRSYLECPYLYYLRHVLKLGRLDDQAVELDSLQFGSLAHDVLQSFAESPLAHSDKANAIAALLTTRLDERAQMLFGKNRLPAVTLQLEQLTERLRAFAEWQAEWRSQGWELQEAEFLIDPAAAILRLGSDGALVRLSGRIDRIDYHPKEKRYAIFDYKTGETKLKISKIRDKKTQEWLDLQLPLYEFALREMGFNEAFDLGFLPIDGTGTELEPEMIRLSKEDLESATAKAIEVARLVRQGAFSPSEKRHRKNEYEVLYGTSVYFEAETENSGESEEEEAK